MSRREESLSKCVGRSGHTKGNLATLTSLLKDSYGEYSLPWLC
jgi:hypothetical protein